MEFRNVSFAYPGMGQEWVLKNVNLTILPGETVGILGATGCGKTSLVNLIPRFYDVSEGGVFVDDIDVRNYKLVNLRDKIAVALQKSEIFCASIKENILWGNPGADTEMLEQAIKTAQASEFIAEKRKEWIRRSAREGTAFPEDKNRGLPSAEPF